MDNVVVGRIEVRPPLNEAEREHLDRLASSSSTMRGTPTGRGDTSLPFTHLTWESCAAGCCLSWNGLGDVRHVGVTLRFVVEHLLQPGAKVEGHPQFRDFTCDHVLDGLVMACDPSGRTYVAEVSGNRVSAREGRPACDDRAEVRRTSPARPRPANVIELRPRRA